MNAERRSLKFDSFQSALSEAEHLLESGYERHGTWDLAQACDHLAAWLTLSMDGFPRPHLWMRLFLMVLRQTVGHRELLRVLDCGQFAPGAPTFRSTILSAGRDPLSAIKRLKRVTNRFDSHLGPLFDSPLYGKLTYSQWHSLHLIHCAHHLGYLWPQNGSESHSDRR